MLKVKVEGEAMAKGESKPWKTILGTFGNAFTLNAPQLAMGDDGRSKTTQMKNSTLRHFVPGNGVDAEREQCAYDVAEYCKTDGLNDPSWKRYL